MELMEVKKSLRKLEKVGHIIRKWYSFSIKLGELREILSNYQNQLIILWLE